MKGHIRGVKMFIYCYLLGVFLSWASYPVLIHLTFAVPLAISQSIYSIITTLVLLSFIYINLYDLGEKDRTRILVQLTKAKVLYVLLLDSCWWCWLKLL